jgi:hypothetical protein
MIYSAYAATDAKAMSKIDPPMVNCVNTPNILFSSQYAKGSAKKFKLFDT